MRLAFDTEETIVSFDPEWSPPSGGHRMALAFACESPDQVDAAFSELTTAGFEGHLPTWDAFWGMRYAVVHDPDRTPVDLYASLPLRRSEVLLEAAVRRCPDASMRRSLSTPELADRPSPAGLDEPAPGSAESASCRLGGRTGEGAIPNFH